MKSLKVFLTLIVIIVSFEKGNTQTAMVTKSSNEIKLATGEYVTEVLGSDNEGFYVLSTNQGMASSMTKKFTIQKLDNSRLSKIWTKEFSLNISSEPVEGIYYLNEKIVVFYSTWEKSDKTKTLNIKTISSKGEIMDSPGKEVRIKTGIFDFANRKFYFSFSSDKSKILVTNKFQDKKKPEEVTVAVLNATDFKKTNEKIIPNKFNNSPTLTYNYQLDNNGNIYYLASYQVSELNINTNFCTIKSSESEPKFLPITLSNQCLTNAALFFRIKEFNLSDAGKDYIENANELSYQILPDNKIILAGLFRDFKQKRCGFFISTIDVITFKSIGQKEQYFTDGLIEQIKSNEKGKNPIDCDFGFNSINQTGNSFIFFYDIFKVVGYSPEMSILSDNIGKIAVTISNNDVVRTDFFVDNSRNVGSSKIAIQKYIKNDKIYMLFGVPNAKSINGSSLQPFLSKYEEAKVKNNDLSFIELTEKGISNIYFGTSTTIKKESRFMIENFITVNGSFLLPLIDYNNATNSSSYTKYELIDLK